MTIRKTDQYKNYHEVRQVGRPGADRVVITPPTDTPRILRQPAIWRLACDLADRFAGETKAAENEQKRRSFAQKLLSKLIRRFV
ncbi:hypothetical protein COT42_05400 [Candidatus Saganbacteria bacterium CG08_land_8_20_14_0_20_45_16]|uniref:Uncharacterized protein n=1 Tax=Candidatus Saganbacteria bacterium CG08_land_8_20_14_0_20_45_16 TaxID=2014293 RepID=A0A2H0XX14_UNCSA|nr:MAG: hypothetical protein COT42_05400 [Candidatus Saganbacteria bacterium CG08_land_8_20_14_0_20_45_16]